MKAIMTDFDIAKGLDRDAGQFHAISYEDVSLTNKAMRIIRSAAEDMVVNHAPLAGPGPLSLAKALALFCDRVLWDAASGDLILISDLDRKTFCLPIPREHWSVRRTGWIQ